jgi:hypothetical protein
MLFLAGLCAGLWDVVPTLFRRGGLPSGEAFMLGKTLPMVGFLSILAWWSLMRAFSWIEIAPRELRKCSLLCWTRRIPWASITSIKRRDETAQISFLALGMATGHGGGSSLVLYRGWVRLPVTIPAYYKDQWQMIEAIRSKCPTATFSG